MVNNKTIKFLSSLKIGAILYCICRSFGRSVGQVMLSQYFIPFAEKLPNVIQWISQESRGFLLTFRSNVQSSWSNCWSLYNCFPLNIFEPSDLKLPNLVS